MIFSNIAHKLRTPAVIFLHFVLAYILMAIARIVYLLENFSTLGQSIQHNDFSSLLLGSFVFDTSALMYINVLFVISVIIFPYKWNRISTWIFTIFNSAALIANFADAAYFPFTGHRTTISVFTEFANESNILEIVLKEAADNWYMVLLAIVLIIATFYTSRWLSAKIWHSDDVTGRTSDIIVRAVTFVLFLPLCVAGLRGGFSKAIRPINMSNANQYVSHPVEAALILNTPFSVIRTIGKESFTDPGYFDADKLNDIYSPVHIAQYEKPLKEKNVVILIVESFGQEYIGNYNKELEGGSYKGYAPFVDSLFNLSLSFEYSFSNGRKSIDAMPSILSGIPHFIEPFVSSPASLNSVGSLVDDLGKRGYYSAFFHGAENGSMGFEAYAKAVGYNDYFGRTEFDGDERFDGEKEFDGTWAIWDEPFLQYYALKMSEFNEPFVTTVYTASSHHPFVVPEHYREVYYDEPVPQGEDVNRSENPMHKCIRYTDMSLQRFFDTARKQPWYENTIFVLTADHPNISDHGIYCTDLGLYQVPIMFFDPSGQMPRGVMPSIAQHTDIYPTVMGYLGIERPFVAWGLNLLDTPSADTWAVQYNGMYQFVKGDYLIQFDGNCLNAVYAFRTDKHLAHNLINEIGDSDVIADQVDELKAIIQTYMQRMENNELLVRN